MSLKCCPVSQELCIHLAAALGEDREHKCPEEERLLGQSSPGMVGAALWSIWHLNLKGKLWALKNSHKGGDVS